MDQFEIIKMVLGWVVVVLTATQFIPQAVKSWRTKSTKDLSWWTLVQIFVITILWIFYGFWNGLPEVIIANLFVNIVIDTILIRKYLSERKQ